MGIRKLSTSVRVPKTLVQKEEEMEVVEILAKRLALDFNEFLYVEKTEDTPYSYLYKGSVWVVDKEFLDEVVGYLIQRGVDGDEKAKELLDKQVGLSLVLSYMAEKQSKQEAQSNEGGDL